MKRKDWRFIRTFAAVTLLALLLLQLWPRNQSNPGVVAAPAWDSAQTEALARRACYDCHSHETNWPWYTSIVPISNLLEYDVNKGREVYNFSTWTAGCCSDEEIERMAAIVGRGQMPPPYYVILHPEARLTAEERGKLVYGLIATMKEGANEP